MSKKKALSSRELEVEKILQSALPEYVIRANMRLVDVIHAGRQFKWMSGYHLDFVICDEHSNPIAAVELDDSTHDTNDGRRRDANKNRWLEESNLKLVRIRTKEEAQNIRALLLSAPSQRQQQHNILSMREANPKGFAECGWQPTPLNQSKRANANQNKSALLAIVFAVFVMWGIYTVITGMMNNAAAQLQRNIQAAQQRVVAAQQIAQQHAQAEAQQRAAAAAKLAAQQTHYEQVLVKGKSARECSTGNVLNNETVRCMNDHYEAVLVANR